MDTHRKLTNRRHRFFVRCLATGIVGVSICWGSMAGQLPDTGQAVCYSASGTVDCADSTYPRQDGSQLGTQGYTKIDAAGTELDATATSWACVRDDATQLVWEEKTADGSLRGVAHRYAWFEHTAAINGSNPGTVGTTDSCSNSLNGQACNTLDYLAAINSSSLCGATDWRLPTQAELLTLVHAGNQKPSIDTVFFPNTAPVPYWSSTTYAKTPSFAWGVHFGYGAAHAESKSVPNAVRLVRGTWLK